MTGTYVDGEPLGGQTATVIDRVRAQHGRRVDGDRRSWAGCSLQPDVGASSETITDQQEQTARRWRLYAPAGFTAAADAQCEVVPGPVDDDGRPLRLEFIAAPSPWWDETGAEHHVQSLLRVSSAASTPSR